MIVTAKQPIESNGLNEVELPEGWSVARLEEICTTPQYGWTTSADNNRTDLKLLRTTDISKGSIDWSSVPGCKEKPHDPPKYLLSPGDIVVSRAGSVGLSCVLKECPRSIFASYLIRFRTLPPIESNFIGMYFKSPRYWSAIADETSGIAIPNVNASKLKKLEVLLPPLAEQKRIVAKVEELLARVNAARERLAKAQKILKRFRQSVLAAACSGRLTADWRNKNPNVESAKEMMENLLQIQGNALKTKNEEFDLKTLREKFGYLAKDNQRFASSGDIPDKWVSASFYNLCILQRGFDLPTQKRHPGKYPIVSSSGISGSHNKAKVKGPCVCVGRSGSVGKTYYVEEDAWPLNTTLYVKEFNGNYPKFVYYYLFYMELEKFSSSTAVPTLNRNTFTFEEVNIPPVKEQKEIARRLDSVFKITDSVMNRKTTAIEQIERLEQSILSKAFRGELVTTEAELARNEDRSYEPASALLERVRRERMTPKTSRPKRGKKHISKAKRMDKRNGKLSRFVKLKAFSVLGHNAVHLLGQIEEEIGDREFSIEEVYTLTSLERGELKSAFFELLNPFAEKKEHESAFVKMKFSKAKGGYIYKLERGK